MPRGRPSKDAAYFKDFAEAYVKNGNNTAAAMRAVGLNDSNGCRFMRQEGVQAAITEARKNAGELMGVSYENVLGMAIQTFKDVSMGLAESAFDCAKLTEARCKALDKIIGMMGYNAPMRTEHARVEATASDFKKMLNQNNQESPEDDDSDVVVEAEIVEDEGEEDCQ